MTWDEEQAAIIEHARARGVDPLFVMAIRKTENGGVGREFGILSESANGYTSQLDKCCATVRNNLARYEKNPLIVHTATPPRLIYSNEFIRWFANIYCPIGADNDPHHLNENWYVNCSVFYANFLTA